MKVTRITLKDFHQFRDVDIDLTYPKGHEKEGQPLDRVCIIGQSGTGKTTLLELIPKFLIGYDTNLFDEIEELLVAGKVKINISFGEKHEFRNVISFMEGDEGELIWHWYDTRRNGKIINADKYLDFFENEWKSINVSRMLYYPSKVDYDINVQGEYDSIEGDIIDFTIDDITGLWKLTMDEIQKYQEQELHIRQEISKAAEDADDAALDNAVQKLKDWKNSNFNPIKDIAEKCLDPLLAPFKLRVKTELDIRKKDDIGFIKIEDVEKNEIPIGLWSTGTKQVVLSALPLYVTKPKNTVILFDEPERSLYPDLQRTIIDYYASFTTNCQFFYATHSPIIASNFDPWEIVELKLDKEGKVYRELYYDGENHVDNYRYNPRYMRWDDILQRIFDLENDGSDERKKMLDELAEKNVKYRKMQQKGTEGSDAGKELLTEILELSRKLSHWAK
jgi:ABC-type lipoprotein export system ATPase subunit